MSSPATTPMSRDQQFCLRWNNYQSNLIQVFNQLFQTESFVDVTLACEGHSVKAHRMVLSACSPYFQTVLLEAPCSHPVIILQGVKWSELKAIIEFIYKGEININQDQLGSLLRVAESLKIRGLADVGGEEAEAVLTSPSGSPRTNSQFWAGEEMPRKRRRLSDDPRSRSRSRSRSPRPSSLTPPSAAEVLDSLVDLQGGPLGPLSRGSSSASNPPPSLPSLPSPSPVSSLANSLSSFAHFHAPMPPPGPPLPPHLAHLPPLSPLSPLLNMHPMPRHHSPEDFEIRPGIAEMIREEERAKLLESTHHWMANPMADGHHHQLLQTLKAQSKFVPPISGDEGSTANFTKRKLRRSLSSKSRSSSVNVENLCHQEDQPPTSFASSSAKSKGTSKWTQEDLASALLMVKTGTPIKPAAEKFHIPVMTLWRRTRALGLVSSKVQCGFRYSTSLRGGSYQSCPSENLLSSHTTIEQQDTLDLELSCRPASSSFLKERSPLTESNHKPPCNLEEPNPYQHMSLKTDELPSNTDEPRLKSEEKPSKENSPVVEVSSPSSGTGKPSSLEPLPIAEAPPKEFLVWLSCLGNLSPKSQFEAKTTPCLLNDKN